MRLTKCLLLALTGLLLSLHSVDRAFAQSQKGIPSDGRDFYLAQMSSSMLCAAITPFQSYWVVACSYYDCNITVSYFDQVTGIEFTDHTYHVLAKQFVQIPINTGYTVVHDPATGQNLNVDGEVPEYTAIHVHADRPINLQYFSTGPDDCEMYLALPTSALGKRYVVAAAPNDDGTGGGTPRNCSTPPEPSSSFFGVVAIKDGTHVSITPSGTTRRGMIPGATSGPGATGTPNQMNISLQRGQVYWVKSEIKTNPGLWDIDMTGSQVDADQPVGVISGCENAFNGVTALGINDNRNLNLEMMVPYDYWASEGYLVMPMKDTPNLPTNDNSYGDQVKVIVGDKSPNGCLSYANLGDLGPRTNAVSPYQFPPVTYDNVDMGSVISSQCGQKIFVEQYDYRAIASRSERQATAPTMMNVIPASRFRTSMMWSVPDDVLQVAKFRFINVIANPTVFGKIKLYKDGKPIGSMSSLASAGSTIFPDPYSHLVGRTYSLGVGCYYATCDSAFAVYQYGMSAYDYPDKDLGDFDNDDYFHAYATPVGQSFGIDGAGLPKITVDTLCQGRPFWMVHVTDTAAIDHFISAIDILKDNLGVIKKRPDADSGYTSYNVEFEPTDFTVVPGLLTKADVKIVVQNPLQKAEAWVWAVNGAGNDTLVHLYYAPPSLAFGAGTSDNVDANGNASVQFLNAQTGVDTCTQFVFKNTATPGAPGAATFTLSNIRFQLGGQGFSVSSTIPPLPAKLAPGDSVIIHVCFNTTQAGRTLYDTLYAETECPIALGYLSGSTTLPEINATDYDYGTVVVGDSVCHVIIVSNTGQAKFKLDTTWVKANFVRDDFRFTDSGLLPVELLPGKSIALNFCFHPSDTVRDSSIVTWGTDISEDRKTVKKNFSVLKGLGIKPNLFWDYADTLIYTECDSARTIRATLSNTGTAQIIVDNIRITPENASDTEWQISNSQGGTKNITLNPNDKVWVDITFTPNLAILRANAWASDAQIQAYDADGKINPIIKLHASVSHAEDVFSPASIDLGIVGPGQVSGTKIVTITNTGTALLIIENIKVDTPFSFGAGSLQQWDTIYPNKSKDVVIQGQTYQDLAKGNLQVQFMTNCGSDVLVPLQITTAAIVPSGTPLSFNTTYECQQNVLQAVASAIGQGYKVVLTGVKIIDDPANPGQAGDFIFDSTGTTSLTMTPGDIMAGGETRTYNVRYTPTSVGTKHAVIEYTFYRQDDPTKTWTIDQPITGIGAVENTTVSLAKDPANPATPYTALTGQVVTIPITLTQPIATTANVYKMTFDVALAQDQFVAGAPNGYFVPAGGYTISSQTETDAGGIATVHVTLESGSPILGGHVADLIGKVAVARQRGSAVTVSNVAFYNQTDPTPLCYVAHNEIPAQFQPTDLCGDSTLRQYLITGKLRFSIGQVSPNPASNSVQVGLDVTDEGTPVTVELFNVTGDNVRTYSTSQIMSVGHKNMDLDLTGLPQGAYTIRVSAPGETGSQMILIQR